MKDIIREIKWAWQRIFHGVDDTFSWSMSCYLEEYFIPEIKEFCNEELKDCLYDKKRKEVYTQMLKLIDNWEKMDNGFDDWYKHNNTSAKMWSFFGRNIGYFWN